MVNAVLSSVQITFRQKWQDDRLTYMHKLTMGDMKGEIFNSAREEEHIDGRHRTALFCTYQNVPDIAG
jgi:hypothetical protein